MFINKINFLKADLENPDGVYKEVTSRVRAFEGRNIPYNVRKLKMNNYSGGQIEFCIFTDEEYDLYIISGSLISDLYPVDDTAEQEISNIRGIISKVYAKGVAGESFTSGVSCTLVQEF